MKTLLNSIPFIGFDAGWILTIDTDGQGLMLLDTHSIKPNHEFGPGMWGGIDGPNAGEEILLFRSSPYSEWEANARPLLELERYETEAIVSLLSRYLNGEKCTKSHIIQLEKLAKKKLCMARDLYSTLTDPKALHDPEQLRIDLAKWQQSLDADLPLPSDPWPLAASITTCSPIALQALDKQVFMSLGEILPRIEIASNKSPKNPIQKYSACVRWNMLAKKYPQILTPPLVRGY
ncbi:MAG: hypothetical protein QM533_11590 [Cytophagales bacterium]|nr:hypothetical protein [Cytophagales bacterium]